MKGILLATDFVKDTDGTFKILETNTSIAIAVQCLNNYMDSVKFKQFLTDNSINEVHLLLPRGASMVDTIDLTSNGGDCDYYIYHFRNSVGEDVTFEIHVSSNGFVPPTVEDGENKLILRMCYDSNALVDETYAKDNFQFIKLLSDNNSPNIVPTYFNDGNGLTVDSLTNGLRDNGVYPNYIIKKRFPVTDYSNNPKVMKINSIEDLNTIKTNLGTDELIQEYVLDTNDLLNGKIKTYRSIQIVYGPNLDVFDFMEPFVHTNKCAIDVDVDYDLNGFIQSWERPKFIQKTNRIGIPKGYHAYSFQRILNTDGSVSHFGEMSVGDSVRSINLFNLENEKMWPKYDEPLSNMSGSTMTDSSVVNIQTMDDFNVVMKFNLSNNTSFLLGRHSTVLTLNSSGRVIFGEAKDLGVGNYLVINRVDNNQFETPTITSIEYSFIPMTRYFFDVEDSDMFLTLSEDSSEYYLINHNPEGICSCYGSCSGFWCPEPCLTPESCFSMDGQECCNTMPICEGKASKDWGPLACDPEMK
jgi:hypothetical protein